MQACFCMANKQRTQGAKSVMALMENFIAFERAMALNKEQNEEAIEDAFDALIALLETTDTLDEEFKVWWVFVDNTAKKQSHSTYMPMERLYEYMQTTPNGQARVYDQLWRICNLGNYTSLPNYFYYHSRPHDTYDNQLFSLKQENGDVVLYRYTKKYGITRTHKHEVPKNWTHANSPNLFGLVIWTAIGLLMEPMNKDGFFIAESNPFKKTRVAAKFTDKCTLTSIV